MSTLNEEKERKIQWATILIWTVIAAVVILLIYQMLTIRNLRNDLDKRVATLTREKKEAVEQAERDGAARAADTLAAGLYPFMSLRGQVPEITDRLLEPVVTAIAGDKTVDVVAVTDQNGTVLASNRTEMNGKPFPGLSAAERSRKKNNGGWEMASPIQLEGPSIGSVVIRTK